MPVGGHDTNLSPISVPGKYADSQFHLLPEKPEIWAKKSPGFRRGIFLVRLLGECLRETTLGNSAVVAEVAECVVQRASDVTLQPLSASFVGDVR